MIRKMYEIEKKELRYFIEIDKYYLASEIFAEIENDEKYTVIIKFKGKTFINETLNHLLWIDEKELEKFVYNFVIEYFENKKYL